MALAGGGGRCGELSQRGFQIARVCAFCVERAVCGYVDIDVIRVGVVFLVEHVADAVLVRVGFLAVFR